MEVLKVVTRFEGKLWSWRLDIRIEQWRWRQRQKDLGYAIEYIPGQEAVPMPGNEKLYAVRSLNMARILVDDDPHSEIWRAKADVSYMDFDTAYCNSITLLEKVE